ncbi:uncharacterized protein SCHCODRAFT_02068317 [Schizophyllum commune H4-8]|uniref:uncharacterized protein n=1 Tax=Schizophyllum commune (strain H4-8 / FGSC 9210) TaxID=578458 RepID=UPI002160228D|nr:uncharacterized protein SCHCODRAFT_02068317 [Schizophyllum commune H4-8]KAI5887564.1 hypothetical protein SCHCODRAFT_02068317 [Schizophyllum commune H4-8]
MKCATYAAAHYIAQRLPAPLHAVATYRPRSPLSTPRVTARPSMQGRRALSPPLLFLSLTPPWVIATTAHDGATKRTTHPLACPIACPRPTYHSYLFTAHHPLLSPLFPPPPPPSPPPLPPSPLTLTTSYADRPTC